MFNVETAATNVNVPRYAHTATVRAALALLHEYCGPFANLTVLEAGCGSISQVELQNCYVVGLDLSRRQLDKNPRLDEKLCGDLHTFETPDWQGRFDLIVCWMVLEHLHHPGGVVAKFARWLKPGGQLILAYTNPCTLKALVTKYTPLWFHCLVKRLANPGRRTQYVRENTFKTYLSPEMALARLQQILLLGCSTIKLILSFEVNESKWLKRFVPARWIAAINHRLLKRDSSFMDCAADGLILVARRQGASVNPSM
jgi:2-polyprenyl-3-methyl-5-hydroxy-6-metoxy-1,4-benzoquinol methylase